MTTPNDAWTKSGAPPTDPPGGAPPPVHLATQRDIRAIEMPKEFAIPGLLPSGAQMIIHSAPKIGKSLLIWSGIAEMLTDGTWWGEAVPDDCFVHMVTEESVGQLQTKFDLVKLPDNPDVTITVRDLLDHRLATNWKALVESIHYAWQDRGAPKICIIDTLGAFAMSAADTNDYGSSLEILSPLNQLRGFWPGVSFVYAHHTRKTGGADGVEGSLGSTALAGGMDCVVGLTPSNRNDTWRNLRGRARWSGDVDLSLSWNETAGRYQKQERPPLRDLLVAALRQESPLTAKDLQGAVEELSGWEPSYQAVGKALRAGFGTFAQAKRSGRTIFWSLLNSEQTD